MQISEADAPNVDGKLNLKNRDTRLACPNSQVEPQGHNRRVVRKSPSCPPFKRDASPITKIGNTRLKEKNSPVTRARGDKGKCSLLTKGNKTAVEIDKPPGILPKQHRAKKKRLKLIRLKVSSLQLIIADRTLKVAPRKTLQVTTSKCRSMSRSSRKARSRSLICAYSLNKKRKKRLCIEGN